VILDVTHFITTGSCSSGKLTSSGPPLTCEPAISSVDPSEPPSHPSEAPVLLADRSIRFSTISVRSLNVVYDVIETAERRDPRLAPRRSIPKRELHKPLRFPLSSHAERLRYMPTFEG